MTESPTFFAPSSWFRHDPSITRAYGCTLSEADGIAEPRTAFQKAVSVLGPIRAFKSGGQWTLDQRPAEPMDFIKAVQRMVDAKPPTTAKDGE